MPIKFGTSKFIASPFLLLGLGLLSASALGCSASVPPEEPEIDDVSSELAVDPGAGAAASAEPAATAQAATQVLVSIPRVLSIRGIDPSYVLGASYQLSVRPLTSMRSFSATVTNGRLTKVGTSSCTVTLVDAAAGRYTIGSLSTSQICTIRVRSINRGTPVGIRYDFVTAANASYSRNMSITFSSACDRRVCLGFSHCVVDNNNNASCVCDAGYHQTPYGCMSGCDADACSGHGICSTDTNGNASCACQDGYRADGLKCVSTVCDDKTCSGHGQCQVVGDATPLCNCEPGYTLSQGGIGCSAAAPPGDRFYVRAADPNSTSCLEVVPSTVDFDFTKGQVRMANCSHDFTWDNNQQWEFGDIGDYVYRIHNRDFPTRWTGSYMYLSLLTDTSDPDVARSAPVGWNSAFSTWELEVADLATRAYRIRSKLSGLVLERSAYGDVFQTTSSASPAQRWVLEGVGSNSDVYYPRSVSREEGAFYWFVPVNAEDRCLTVRPYDAMMADSTVEPCVWSFDEGVIQRFIFEYQSFMNYRIRSANADGNKFLSLLAPTPDQNTLSNAEAATAPVEFRIEWNAPLTPEYISQEWSVVEVANKLYKIKSMRTGKVLTWYQNSRNGRTMIMQRDDAPDSDPVSAFQKWYLKVSQYELR